MYLVTKLDLWTLQRALDSGYDTEEASQLIDELLASAQVELVANGYVAYPEQPPEAEAYDQEYQNEGC